MKSIVVFALSISLAGALSPEATQAQTPVAGTDYIEIPNGRPLEAVDDKVVVEEFFNYICPACFGFEPIFVSWTSQLPPYVEVVHIPATFRPDFVPYARAYYAAQALGIAEETHQAVYDAIHRTHTIPAEGDRIDEERIAGFYADYGVDAKEFLDTMHSFGVELKLRRATEHMQRSRIPSTPSILVNGRYLVRGNTYGQMLEIASFLIEKEHTGS
jgi:protein dithiol oxidoreductase (disulfide-forming)